MRRWKSAGGVLFAAALLSGCQTIKGTFRDTMKPLGDRCGYSAERAYIVGRFVCKSGCSDLLMARLLRKDRLESQEVPFRTGDAVRLTVIEAAPGRFQFSAEAVYYASKKDMALPAELTQPFEVRAGEVLYVGDSVVGQERLLGLIKTGDSLSHEFDLEAARQELRERCGFPAEVPLILLLDRSGAEAAEDGS